MINEVLHSRLIAFVMGSWSVYCGSIGAYDGATFILLFYGLMLLLNHLDQKKPPVLETPMTHKNKSIFRKKYNTWKIKN